MRRSLPHHSEPRLQHLTHRIDPCPQRCIDQVRIALGGADLGVAEEAANHFQRCAARDQQGREGVAQVVDADVGDLRDLLHLWPEALGIADRLVGHVAGEEEGTALRHDLPPQPDQGHCLVRDRHPVDAALFGVGGLLGPDREVEVELVEGGGADLAQPGTGQHAEANDAGGALIFVDGQRIGQALDFFEGQEPITGDLGAAPKPEGGVVVAHLP